jgi:hypothetical protein
VVHGRQVGRPGVEDDDVRLLADFQRADAIRQADGPGPVDGGHLQHAGRRRAVGSPVATLCSLAAVPISPNRSRSLLLAQPSVPSPKRLSPLTHPGHRAMPEASFMLLSGQWETAQPRLAMMSMSASSTQTQWARSVSLVENAQPVQVGDGAQAFLPDGLIPFEAGLGHVHLKSRPSSIGCCLGGLQGVVAAGVG